MTGETSLRFLAIAMLLFQTGRDLNEANHESR